MLSVLGHNAMYPDAASQVCFFHRGYKNLVKNL